MLSTFFYKPIHLAQRSECVLYCTCTLHSTFARLNVSLADFLSVGKACYIVFFLPFDLVRIMQLTVQLRSLRSVSSLVKLNMNCYILKSCVVHTLLYPNCPIPFHPHFLCPRSGMTCFLTPCKTFERDEMVCNSSSASLFSRLSSLVPTT